MKKRLAQATLTNPRHREIIELARLKGFLTTEELARTFNVTSQTIRRDINELAERGLLRALPLGLEHQVYDSSTEIHPHLLIEDSGEVVDLPADCIRWDALPPMAPGLEVAAIDMVVRVRRTAAA